MINAGKTLDEARKNAVKYSQEHPDQYVTLYAQFGIFIQADKRLHVFAPSDSIGDSYWKTGKEKKFTDAQRGADSAATPHMS